jgi:hypothetical protein
MNNHAPVAVLGSGTLPMGHHPGFGKWCKVPLSGSHSSAKGINHTKHQQHAGGLGGGANSRQHALNWGSKQAATTQQSAQQDRGTITHQPSARMPLMQVGRQKRE